MYYLINRICKQLKTDYQNNKRNDERRNVFKALVTERMVTVGGLCRNAKANKRNYG